ncbi:LysR family transcriptional regulator [Romboutsia lituseburensis]|uniref:LysR family transcriptional regulator n=1 Tax=Romboutsia lituseburensis TaxID=1537 RepID=UPI0022EAC067|nr:LysR family transcriptional regulator [Romboutsia lituseburensis]
MDIKTLKYFLQICKDGSFSKASKNLYISQQGLSKAISNLEKELNVPLFNRNSSGNELTKYGEYLQNKAVSIVYQFDILDDGIKNMIKENKVHLKIGVSFGVLNALSIDIINEFRNLYPDIVLDIKEYTDFKCEEAVLNNRVDLGFAISYFDESLFNYEFVKSERLYAIVNKNHHLCNLKEMKFEYLKGEKIIINSNHSKVRHNFLIKCLENKFDPNIYIESDEMILIHDLSKRNEGIGISIDFAHTPTCKISYIPFQDPTFTWNINIITKKNKIIDSNLQSFIDYILEKTKTN